MFHEGGFRDHIQIMDNVTTPPQLVRIQEWVVEEVHPHGIELFLRKVISPDSTVLPPEHVGFSDGRVLVVVPPHVGGGSHLADSST